MRQCILNGGFGENPDDCTTHDHELFTFFVLYGDHNEWFVCRAEDAPHAVEQAADAIDLDVDVLGVFRGVQDDSWMTFETMWVASRRATNANANVNSIVGE